MKHISRIAAMLAVLLLAGLASTALAQHPYRLSEGDMRGLLDRLERDSDQFRQSVDRSLDRSSLDGTRAEDRINDFVQDFAASTSRLRDRYDDNQSASGTVQEVLDRASRIDRFVTNHRLSGRVYDDWRRVRADLDELASTYTVSWNWPVVDVVTTPDAAVVVERHARRVNDEDVKNIIRNIDNEAEHFRHSLHDALNHSHFNHTSTEDDINAFVKNFENSTDRLKDHFGKHNAATDDVEEVMRRAAHIDIFMRDHELSSRSQEDWQNLRRNLDELSAAYNVTWSWEYHWTGKPQGGN
jgi:hypothetical protein